MRPFTGVTLAQIRSSVPFDLLEMTKKTHTIIDANYIAHGAVSSVYIYRVIKSKKKQTKHTINVLYLYDFFEYMKIVIFIFSACIIVRQNLAVLREKKPHLLLLLLTNYNFTSVFIALISNIYKLKTHYIRGNKLIYKNITFLLPAHEVNQNHQNHQNVSEIHNSS